MADPSAGVWVPGGWNSAAGQVVASDERPAASTCRAGSMRLTIDYSGKGFEFFSIEPIRGGIPGLCRKASVWAKAGGDSRTFYAKFKDGKGREEVGGKKLEMPLKTRPGEWVRSDFTIPSGWEQPLTLVGIAGHNWGATTTQGHAELLFHDFEVETDISGVADPRSLVSVGVTCAAAADNNIVVEGERAAWTVAVDSWLGTPLSGKLGWTVHDEHGVAVTGGVEQIAVAGTASAPIVCRPSRYGVYGLDIDIRLTDGVVFTQRSHMAYVPRPRDLSESEKDASPYGLCVHGAVPGTPYRAASRLGFAWVRDYAYTWGWMQRAKGENGQYAGWPWYPKMDQKARGAGLRVLPCLMGAISDGIKGGHLEPDRAFRDAFLHILLTFPQYTAWELDNEYDYKNGRDEAARGWASYDAYHRTFARTVHFMDDKMLAVENGTAGLHPDRVRASIRKGAFDQIDVVNGHFYCGTRPPELARENANTGQSGEVPMMISDVLKDLVSAARSDGRKRQTWITEFGWDTLAVHIVSEHEQAAYLQRGYLMGLLCGIDRMFWYWDRDSKAPPANFFDGCGLLDPREEPKPAAVAMAALVHRLKQPRVLGTCDYGRNTGGYVVRDGGRLVACAFLLDPSGPPASATFPDGELSDMYGNPLAGRQQSLDVAPVWIDGLSEHDPIVLQAAYDISTPRYVRATAGDPFVVNLQVRNTRSTPLKASFTAAAPAGWALEAVTQAIEVPVGQEETIPVRVTIDPKAALGPQRLALVVEEGAVRKTLPVEVEVMPYAVVKAQPLAGAPGRASMTVSLHNNSLQARSFVLKPAVPKPWSVEPVSATLDAVGVGSNRTATFAVTWTTEWKPGERAEVEVLTADGARIGSGPISPGTIPLPAVAGIRFDGDVADWPAAARLPEWSLGSDHGAGDAEVYAGWSTAGLSLAVVVHNSKAEVYDPKSFWGGDCLELFVDTADSKAGRSSYAPTDHQFWFCPMVKTGRVYAGRWKRGDEIPETQYDLKGVEGVSRKTSDGYVMEMLLPASQITGFAPRQGGTLGIGLSLTVHGTDGTLREVFWPVSKADGATEKPQTWGSVQLR